MQDGFFLDHHTQNVKMSLLAFNGDAQQYMLTDVTFSFESSGMIPVESSISVFRRWPYESRLDFFRLFLEIVFMLMVFYQVVAELRELADYVKEAKTVCQGVCAYWTDFNNVVDWISMALTVITIVHWFHIVFLMYEFDPKSRYPVYMATPAGFDCKSGRYACMFETN